MNAIQDESYISFTNASQSKKDFLKFLEVMCEDVAYEFVNELWCMDDIKSFWKQWDGDLDLLGHQVVLFDCERLELV